jgi:dolichyl-phosphate-mannose-protein mannosyltransferase
VTVTDDGLRSGDAEPPANPSVTDLAQIEAHRARVRHRLIPPLPTDRVAGWVGALSVTALAGFLRFWNLGKPHAFVFDETYYAKDAYALLQNGYEQDYIEKADEQLLRGNLDVFADTASYVVHPPLGKWIIAAGEHFFGMDPFGWRVAIAVLGTLSVLLLARLVRRVTGSTVLGTIAGFLLAIDGMHLVMSRTALLDLPVSFFLLVAFGALVLDREQGRRRAGTRLDEFEVSSLGPGLGFRPWRLAAGIALGLALATKWNALFFIAAFGLLTVWWDVSARRVAGARSPWLGALTKDALPAFLAIVPTAIVTYVVTWSGWLFTSGGYHRSWGSDNPSTYFGWIPNPLRSLWHYHAEAWRFHTDLTSDHAYESHPWSWLVQGRPVSFFYEEYERGEMGCEVEKCAREILGVGNPIIWWSATAAIIVMAWLVISRRDWRAGAVLASLAAGWLPWFFYADHNDRTMFSFYAVAFLPFLIMAITICLGFILGPPNASPTRRTVGATAVGAYLLLAALASAALLPLWLGQTLPYDEWLDRLFGLRSWV